MNAETPLMAGVDEAGRGPLAGPVVAAAVLFQVDDPPPGIADSKKLSEHQRQRMELAIKETSCWSVSYASVAEIDKLNILQASLLAMRRAVLALESMPQLVLVDGNRCPDLPCLVQSVVGGDATVPQISAASILAKVERDRYMFKQAHLYPGYGFERHKGYPTQFHREALTRLGVTPIHRRSFAPVKRILTEP